jgi:uroporphyrin-3 C-methyltransferase
MDSKQFNEEIQDLADDPVDRLLQEKTPASSGKSIAILALLVALAAVGTSGWQWWQIHQGDSNETTQIASLKRLHDTQMQLASSVASFKTQLEATESPLDAAEFSRQGERLNAVESKLGDLQGQSSEDRASISGVQGSVRSMEQRLSTTESGLISVAASNQNSSVELDIAEIDFLLRTASERLQLFSDPNAADLALQAADVQIEALNDPMFLSVRQRIASTRQALALVPVIDRVEISSRLLAMQSKVSDLPFRGEVVAAPEPELPADAGWWESFKQTMSSLVIVRRRVAEDPLVLSLDDKDYLRLGLWLQLESAQLALMRNDTSVYAGSLDRVNNTLLQFFQTNASGVEALLIEIAALKQVNIAPEMPDVSAPWTQLRQLRDSRRLLQSATPVESGDPGE